MTCLQCGFVSPEGFRFCGQCGATLQEIASTPDAERRQITVLFCDLVGSTNLSASFDPEEFRDIMRAYQQTCAHCIGQFDGYIAQYLGDGVLVYFGYPHAHEEDAQRAVYASIEMRQAMIDLNNRFATILQEPLAIRIGIHTGLVVVGEFGTGENRELLAIGDTPNIAAKLQQYADANSIVMSGAAHRLVQGFFDVEFAGAKTIKGFSTPIDVYNVIGLSGAHHRFESVASAALTTFTGRGVETTNLLKDWKHIDEQGQAILISGDAGVGKSRLLHSFKQKLARELHIRLECFCSPYHQHTPMYPIIDMMNRMMGIQQLDSESKKLRKVEEISNRYHLNPQETIPAISSILGIDVPSHVGKHLKTSQSHYETLIAFLEAITRKVPVLCIVEDLHWCDPSSLDLFHRLIPNVPRMRLLFIGTTRPTFQPPWKSDAITALHLHGLPRNESEEMVLHVTRGKSLPMEVVHQIVEKTDGIPLFIEELTKMIVESEMLKEGSDHYELRHPLPPLAIPSTLHDSLVARLDKLSTVREVIQLGAAVGREFSFALLHSICDIKDETLTAALEKLVASELLYQQGIPPNSSYLFKHALVQDAAYESILKSKRQQYHLRIARAITKDFQEMLIDQPGVVAHHFTEAGLGEEAILYWLLAGQQSLRRSAHTEAITQLKKGLEILLALEEGRSRDQLELEYLVSLGPALIAKMGYHSQEVVRLYDRASELVALLPESIYQIPVLFGRWITQMISGNIDECLRLSDIIFETASRDPSQKEMLGANIVRGVTYVQFGNFLEALPLLRRSAELSQTSPVADSLLTYGQDPEVVSNAFLSMCLWILGYFDQSFVKSEETLLQSRRLAHPYTHALCANIIAQIYIWNNHLPQARALIDEVIENAKEFGYAHWQAMGRIVKGAILIKEHHVEEGLTFLHSGTAAFHDIGSMVAEPMLLFFFAEAHRQIGQNEKAMHYVERAKHAATQLHSRHYQSLALHAEALLLIDSGKSHPQQIEDLLLEAISLSRETNAKWVELHVSNTFATFLLQQGKVHEAASRLRNIVDSIPEGSTSTDVQIAINILESIRDNEIVKS